MANVILDDLDRRLIDLLGRDARISNRRIAADLDVTEGTIRARIKRLESENLIRFTAITHIQDMENYRLAFVRLQIDLSKLDQICEQLQSMEMVGAMQVTMGRFNILVVVAFNDIDQLHDLTSRQILAISGVKHVETAIAVKTLKYDYRVARIL